MTRPPSHLRFTCRTGHRDFSFSSTPNYSDLFISDAVQIRLMFSFVEGFRNNETATKVIKYIKQLYQKADLIHGDLSEYNIMIWENEPVIFDVSQAVPSTHPLAENLLKRDLENINRFFKKLKVKISPTNEIYKKIVSKNV